MKLQNTSLEMSTTIMKEKRYDGIVLVPDIF